MGGGRRQSLLLRPPPQMPVPPALDRPPCPGQTPRAPAAEPRLALPPSPGAHLFIKLSTIRNPAAGVFPALWFERPLIRS